MRERVPENLWETDWEEEEEEELIWMMAENDEMPNVIKEGSER